MAEVVKEPWSDRATAAAPADDPDADYHPRRPSGLNPLSLPGPLTLKQKLYILLPQTLGAAFIDGAANFGIACAMYRTVKPPKQILMWPLDQNTIAGDMAVTTFIQGIATFCIASGMVHVDLRHNKIDAFPYPWPDTAFASIKLSPPSPTQPLHGRLWRHFHNEHGLGRGLHFFSGSDVNDIFDFSIPKKQLAQRWFWSIWKGSVLSALYFLIVWPIAIAITAPLYGGRDMVGTWIPEIIKLLYGAILGLSMNPICCLIAMGSEDSVRHHRAEMQRRRFADANPRASTTTAAERVKGTFGKVRRLTVGKGSQPTPEDLEKGGENMDKRPGPQRRTSDDYQGKRLRTSTGTPPLSPSTSIRRHHHHEGVPSVAGFRRSLDGRPASPERPETPVDRRKSFEAALRQGGTAGLNRSGSGRAVSEVGRERDEGEGDVGEETLTEKDPEKEDDFDPAHAGPAAGRKGRLRRLTEATEAPSISSGEEG